MMKTIREALNDKYSVTGATIVDALNQANGTESDTIAECVIDSTEDDGE